jgi:predicted transcriptional regulator
MVTSSKIKKILPKLRQPLELDYIASSLLEIDKENAEKILDELVDDGILLKENNQYKIRNKQ